jgi:hypothetical protein
MKAALVALGLFSATALAQTADTTNRQPIYSMVSVDASLLVHRPKITNGYSVGIGLESETESREWVSFTHLDYAWSSTGPSHGYDWAIFAGLGIRAVRDVFVGAQLGTSVTDFRDQAPLVSLFIRQTLDYRVLHWYHGSFLEFNVGSMGGGPGPSTSLRIGLRFL